MASDAPIDKWSLTGNEATNSDFLGTTNNQSLRIRTNDTERMRVLADGKVVINGTSPITDTRLTVSESDANRADDIASDGSIASKHVGLRFPIGPGPAEMMETKAVEVKEDKVKHEKAKDKTAASTESDIQAVEKHSSSEPQLLQEQQPADTPVKSSNNNMQLQESK